MPVTLLHLDLPASPTSVGEARDALEALAQEIGRDVLPDLRLLVSEMVTNAVRHSGADDGARVTLVAQRIPDCVRIEVHDGGPGFPAPDEPTPRSEGTSGWGLFLVQKLARAWGTEPAPDAHVWFELATA